MEPFLFSLFFFLLGASAGSFLNVCICRLPEKESIVSPRSHCPKCSKEILIRDNIPIVSYILLGGRCRNCKEKISVLYPLIELLTGLVFLYFFYLFKLRLELLPNLIFVCSLISISAIDIKHRIIPNEISIPFIFLGILFSPLLHITWLDSILGALIGGSTLYLIAAVYSFLTKKEGMGMGDVKLLAMIGAFLGVRGVLLALVFGSFLGTLGGLFMIIWKGKGREYPIPFGLFLSIGAVVTLLWGNGLLRAYMEFIMSFR